MISRTDFLPDFGILISGTSDLTFALQNDFSKFGFSDVHCTDHQRCMEEVLKSEPDVVILVAEGHEAVAMELCYMLKLSIRAHGARVVVLAPNYQPETALEFFKAGADDCLGSPFPFELLCYRLLRQVQTSVSASTSILQFRNGQQSLQIDKESYQAFLNNIAIHLTRKEFELLFQMANEPGKIFSREELFRAVWKENTSPNGRTIDVHILRLRKKVGEHYFSTLKGVGYRFNTRS